MSVSVVIVTRDDPRIHDCVASILSQRTSFEFRLVLVDNSGRAEFVEDLRRRWGGHQSVRIESITGPFSGAWNQAAFRETSDVIARIDADTVAHPEWLARLVHPLRERAGLAWSAGGVVGPEPLRSVTQRYFDHRTLAYQRRLAGKVLPTDAVPSWNVAYRAAALRDVTGYDPWQRSSIDWDLHKRLALKGYVGVFVPDARVTHDHPDRLREFYRKEAWYRTGQYQMTLKYGPLTMLAAYTLPGAYLALSALALLGAWDARLAYIAALGLGFLLFKQWLSGIMERDPVWWSRPFFRILEAVAAVHGLLRGLVAYGLRRRPAPGLE